MLSAREHLNYLSAIENKFISIRKIPALLLAALFLIVLVNVLVKMDADNLQWVKESVKMKQVIQPDASVTENIGVNLLTRYLLPFEAISILLMVALIGAAHLSRREDTA
jgi:NADH:ubiquinone oxidoreductase subunit 6 (subunit J)